MIRIAQPFFQGVEGERRLQAFDGLTLAAHSALQTGDVPSLGQTMQEANQLLTEAGVVPQALHDMITAARECGLLAVKTTGAGGGGMLLGPLDPERADEQHRAVRNCFEGHAVYRVSLDGQSR
jgi:mevalonate kinase